MSRPEYGSPEWRALVGKDDQVFSDRVLDEAQAAADAEMASRVGTFRADPAAYEAGCRALGLRPEAAAASRYRRAVDAALAVALPAELRRLANAWEHLRSTYPGDPEKFDRDAGRVGAYAASLRQTADAWERR